MRRLWKPWPLLVCALAYLAGADTAVCQLPGTFRDGGQEWGIDVDISGSMQVLGHGAAFVDTDGDGTEELFVVMGPDQPNRIYQLGADGRYHDTAPSQLLDTTTDGRGVAFADFDNDGDQDCFVSSFNQPNHLYRHEHNGFYTDITAVAGLSHSTKSYSAAWADFDNDGDLDLFVCVYGTVAAPQPSLMYVNNGDGTFREIAHMAGVDQPDMPALAAIWIDYDNDGDQDLYLCNDKDRGNRMYRNDGNETFSDQSVASHTDLVFNAMGLAVADYDNDGWLDIYVSNLPRGNELLHNNGNGTFTWSAERAGVAAYFISWGCAFLDHDNDGDQDLYVVGFHMANMNRANRFFDNNGNGTFTEIGPDIGVDSESTDFGLAVGDPNDDGFPDMYVATIGGPSHLFLNNPTDNNWTKIRTQGTISNRDGVGAVVRVSAGGHTQVLDVRRGSSYLSMNNPDLMFGLGQNAVIDSVTVDWPSGLHDRWLAPPINMALVMHEGGALEIPVRYQNLGTTPVPGGVSIDWTLKPNPGLTGTVIYRREDGVGPESIVSGATPLAATTTHFVDHSAQPQHHYRYQIAALLTNGTETRSRPLATVTPAANAILHQNAPNPSNPSTTITYEIPYPGQVSLEILDVRGALIKTVFANTRPAGPGAAIWDGQDDRGQQVSSGVYFYRLRVGNDVLTRSMVQIK